MGRRLRALLVGSGLVWALAACAPDAGLDDGDRLRVVASIYPLRFAAEQIGGEDVLVENLTPAGAEPHDLELRPAQVRALADADLVAYLGSGFQPAVEDVVSGLDEARRFDVLEAKNLLEDAQAPTAEEDRAGEAADPHVWLDPLIMASMARRLGARLADIDGANSGDYERRAKRLGARLEALHEQYRRGLIDCRRRQFVTSHAAFGYLATRYGLQQVTVSGLDPESEPTPGRLAEIARFVRQEGVRTLFVEELVSPDVAQTLARETGATVEVLSPLESEPEAGDYFDAMRVNLTKLREALDCA